MSIGNKRPLSCDEQSLRALQILKQSFYCDGEGRAYLRINTAWLDKSKLWKPMGYEEKEMIVPEPILEQIPESVRKGFFARLWNWIKNIFSL